MAYEALRTKANRSRRLAAHISATKGADAIGSAESLGFAKQAATAPAKAAAPQTKTIEKKAPTDTDVFLAGHRAKKAERDRIAKVFQANVTKGRERTALSLLAFHEESADQIIKMLGGLPSDTEFELLRAANAQKSSAEMWDKVHAEVFAERNPQSLVDNMRGRFGLSGHDTEAKADLLTDNMKSRFTTAN